MRQRLYLIFTPQGTTNEELKRENEAFRLRLEIIQRGSNGEAKTTTESADASEEK